MPVALYALAAGAFGIGVTEFVILGLLLEIARDLGVPVAAAGMLISGYALGAWADGIVISQGPGLKILPLATAAFPTLAIPVALAAFALDRRRDPSSNSPQQTAC